MSCDLSLHDPFEVIVGSAQARLLLLGDHASNRVPAPYGDLGLAPGQIERHIGYDIGVAWLLHRLAELASAPALMTTFTRLLIDPNRGEDDPTLVMRLSDGAIVPGNAAVDAEERRRRIEGFHRPYHQAIDHKLEEMLGNRIVPAIVSLHSFTPSWKGVARPWEVAVLWDSDPRLPLPFMAALRAEGWTVGDNQPYDGALRNDTMFHHATRRGLAHILIEVRQDLIATREGAEAWAGRLWATLAPLLERPEMGEIRHFPSRCGAYEPL